MPSKRTTIWLTEAAQAAIAGAPSTSSAISGMVADYGEFARRLGANPVHPDSADAIRSALNRYERCWREAMPTLARGEWLLICDALNAAWRSGASGQDIADLLAAEIADTAPDGLGEKWGADIPALAARLADMPFAARAAIIEVVDRFWAGVTGGLQSHDEMLAAAGARVTPRRNHD